MQGPCLFPFNVEKQTALQSVLEVMLARSGHLFALYVTNVGSTPYVSPERTFFIACFLPDILLCA